MKRRKPTGPVIYSRKNLEKAGLCLVTAFDWSSVPPGEKYWAGVYKRLHNLANSLKAKPRRRR